MIGGLGKSQTEDCPCLGSVANAGRDPPLYCQWDRAFFISGVSWSKGTLIVSPGFKFFLLIRVKLTTVVVYWLKGGCSITDWLLRPLNFKVPSFLLCATDDGDVIDLLCLSERITAVTI